MAKFIGLLIGYMVSYGIYAMMSNWVILPFISLLCALTGLTAIVGILQFVVTIAFMVISYNAMCRLMAWVSKTIESFLNTKLCAAA